MAEKDTFGQRLIANMTEGLDMLRSEPDRLESREVSLSPSIKTPRALADSGISRKAALPHKETVKAIKAKH